MHSAGSDTRLLGPWIRATWAGWALGVPLVVLLALTGLCHLIPAFFALAGTAVIAGAPLVADGARALWQTVLALVATVRAAWTRPGIGAVGATLLALLVAPFAAGWRLWKSSTTFQWVAAVLPIGGLISAFWVLPFVWMLLPCCSCCPANCEASLTIDSSSADPKRSSQ